MIIYSLKEKMSDEFGTFYKLKLLWKKTIVIPNYRTTFFENKLEYHLCNKNNRYYYFKFVDHKLEYVSNKYRTNHMIKNIYHIIQNIEKLNNGKIRKYHIYSALELEVLCDYLRNNNILHRIKIEPYKAEPPETNFECFSYDEYNDINKLDFFKHTGSNDYDYEYNTIIRRYKLYIQVYKGFENLHNIEVSNKERPKYGIYLYPSLYKKIK